MKTVGRGNIMTTATSRRVTGQGPILTLNQEPPLLSRDNHHEIFTYQIKSRYTFLNPDELFDRPSAVLILSRVLRLFPLVQRVAPLLQVQALEVEDSDISVLTECLGLWIGYWHRQGLAMLVLSLDDVDWSHCRLIIQVA